MRRLGVGFTLFLILRLIWIATAAAGHTAEGQADWYEDWEQRVEEAGILSPALLDERRTFAEIHEVHARQPLASSPDSYTGMGSNVEQWRGLVAGYGGWNVNTMLCLMGHESGGNPNALNPTSGAAGLLQVMPFWWNHYGGDRFNPATNVGVAHKIWQQQGYSAWSPWRRGLCRA